MALGVWNKYKILSLVLVLFVYNSENSKEINNTSNNVASVTDVNKTNIKTFCEKSAKESKGVVNESSCDTNLITEFNSHINDFDRSSKQHSLFGKEKEQKNNEEESTRKIRILRRGVQEPIQKNEIQDEKSRSIVENSSSSDEKSKKYKKENQVLKDRIKKENHIKNSFRQVYTDKNKKPFKSNCFDKSKNKKSDCADKENDSKDSFKFNKRNDASAEGLMSDSNQNQNNLNNNSSGKNQTYYDKNSVKDFQSNFPEPNKQDFSENNQSCSSEKYHNILDEIFSLSIYFDLFVQDDNNSKLIDNQNIPINENFIMNILKLKNLESNNRNANIEDEKKSYANILKNNNHGFTCNLKPFKSQTSKKEQNIKTKNNLTLQKPNNNSLENSFISHFNNEDGLEHLWDNATNSTNKNILNDILTINSSKEHIGNIRKEQNKINENKQHSHFNKKGDSKRIFIEYHYPHNFKSPPSKKCCGNCCTYVPKYEKFIQCFIIDVSDLYNPKNLQKISINYSRNELGQTIFKYISSRNINEIEVSYIVNTVLNELSDVDQFEIVVFVIFLVWCTKSFKEYGSLNNQGYTTVNYFTRHTKYLHLIDVKSSLKESLCYWKNQNYKIDNLFEAFEILFDVLLRKCFILNYLKSDKTFKLLLSFKNELFNGLRFFLRYNDSENFGNLKIYC